MSRLPTSKALATVPSPIRFTKLTGPVSAPVSSSAWPKITLVSASSISKRPSCVVAANAPMSSLKNTLAVPVSMVRSKAPLAWLSMEASFVKRTFAPPVAVSAVSSVSIRTSIRNSTGPLKRAVPLKVVTVSVAPGRSAEPRNTIQPLRFSPLRAVRSSSMKMQPPPPPQSVIVRLPTSIADSTTLPASTTRSSTTNPAESSKAPNVTFPDVKAISVQASITKS